MIGFSKPVLLAPWKGQRLVLCVYLGMRYVTGGGVLVFPVNPDSLGNREVILVVFCVYTWLVQLPL